MQPCCLAHCSRINHTKELLTQRWLTSPHSLNGWRIINAALNRADKQIWRVHQGLPAVPFKPLPNCTHEPRHQHWLMESMQVHCRACRTTYDLDLIEEWSRMERA